MPAAPPRSVSRAWFAGRGWRLRAHQRAMLEAAAAGRDALLVAPTGGGKTLGGFLPSLVELAGSGVPQGLHTLYVSPLKALTNDIARNLAAPVGEMGLPVSYEVRTGDTPSNRRERQPLERPRARGAKAAADAADDAGVAGVAALLPGRRQLFRRAAAGRARRAARAGREQERGAAEPRARPPARPGARRPLRRPVGDGGRPRPPAQLPDAAAGVRRRGVRGGRG